MKSRVSGKILIHSALSMIVAVGLPAIGCKSKPVTPDDAGLNTSVQSRLQADAGLTGQQIQTNVQGGVVTLTGNVSNEAARSLAANDASEVAGIRTVVNSLVLTTAAVTSPTQPISPVPVREGTAKQKIESTVKPVRQYEPSPAPVSRQSADNVPPPQPPPPPPVRQPAPPAFRNVSVPVGTGLSVRITQTLDSQSTQPGATFSGVLASDVIVDGAVAFTAGTPVTGHVDDAKDAGHFSGSSLLAISLNGIRRRGETIPITTDTFSKQGKGRGKNTAEKIGGGAAVGAILGGIFGGGKGAAIGAGAGGGLGAGANGVTRGEQVQIASESLVRFRLTTAVTVRTSTQPDSETPNGDLRRRDQ